MATWAAWGRFALCSLLLNFVWESWHAVWLYRGFDEPGLFAVESFRQFVRMMTRVSLTDAALLLGVAAAGMVLWRDGSGCCTARLAGSGTSVPRRYSWPPP